MADKPILAIALGDAAGVGPEIVAKAMLDEGIRSVCRPLIVGKEWVLAQAFALVGGALPLRRLTAASQAAYRADELDVLEVGDLRPEDVHVGQLGVVTGRESGEALVLAAQMVASGQAHGLVSAPVNKGALALAGFGHGHLEVVAQAIGAPGPFSSLLAGPRLKVINMTDHCAVAEALRRITRERIITSLRLAQQSFRQWGYERPRIAVCAVNPHNGDNGTFGREEIDVIAPAVAAARDEGIDACGPLPVDTLFARAIAGEFDVVLAMYHDQGFTPVKTVGLHDTASLGLGLPIPYATTDHGTGFDLAGRGVANPGSLKQAFRAVVELCIGTHAFA